MSCARGRLSWLLSLVCFWAHVIVISYRIVWYCLLQFANYLVGSIFVRCLLLRAIQTVTDDRTYHTQTCNLLIFPSIEVESVRNLLHATRQIVNLLSHTATKPCWCMRHRTQTSLLNLDLPPPPWARETDWSRIGGHCAKIFKVLSFSIPHLWTMSANCFNFWVS